ncbi:MAG: hypothetical protein EP329_22430 [Deltaproteobacteria bacterium]|nr:MAG: hypothetical protein EP329_22430 [Deltaproteobacteria bacterium]
MNRKPSHPTPHTRAASLLIALTLGLIACGDASAPPVVLDLEDANPLVARTAIRSTATWPAVAALPEACDAERPFEVFFAPDDPTVTLELTWIDSVRAARALDPQTYVEGHNPWRIRYAVYNLSHATIVAHLLAAEAEGVDVQVLIEADRMADPWSELASQFSGAGLEVHAAHRELTAAQRATADLVGVADDGLMHLKLRLFETPTWRALLTGSQNPNAAAAANDETLHLIRDDAVIARYARAYADVLAGRAITNVWDDDAAVNVLFSPAADGTERAATRLLQWLDEEQEQILLMVFSLRNVKSPDFRYSLLSTLRWKHEHGVPVYVITDRKQSDGVDAGGQPMEGWYDDWMDDNLREAGIPVLEVVNTARAYFGADNPYAAMHSKVAVLGRSRIRVVTDSANWSTAALGSDAKAEKNVESMLFIDSLALDGNATGRRYLTQWLRVLRRYEDQRGADMPRADEVLATLSALPGWPRQPLAFAADESETVMGQYVHAVGDRPELGDWGRAGSGVAMTTDGASYPSWWAPQAVALPLGATFSWKLTVWDRAGVIAWESGDNRVSTALPSVCAGAAEPVTGTWR